VNIRSAVTRFAANISVSRIARRSRSGGNLMSANGAIAPNAKSKTAMSANATRVCCRVGGRYNSESEVRFGTADVTFLARCITGTRLSRNTNFYLKELIWLKYRKGHVRSGSDGHPVSHRCPLWLRSRHSEGNRQLPLHPRKGTFVGMSGNFCAVHVR